MGGGNKIERIFLFYRLIYFSQKIFPVKITMSEIRNLEELLSTHFGATYEILDHSTTNLTALGDNYGSTILALSVKLRNRLTKDEETVELVAKMAPKDPMFFNLFQVPVSFPKEASMYTSVARALKDHQEKHSVPEDLYLDCFCECFGVRRNLTGSEIVDMDAVLVLENLKPKGFACGSRSEGCHRRVPAAVSEAGCSAPERRSSR